MVARPGAIQYSFNSGEFAPGAAGRADIKQYYAGAKYMLNAEPKPQGGFRLLPRTRDIGYVRGTLASEAGTFTLFAGPHAAAATVATFDLAAPKNIALLDVTGFLADVAIADGLQVQYFDGSVWVNISAPLDVATTAKTRRVGLAPGAFATATQFRLHLVVVPSGPATFTVAGMTAWRESSVATVGRQFQVTVSPSDALTAVVSEGHVDFWKSGVFVGCAAAPFTAAQLTNITRTQRLETLLLWHEDVGTARFVRNGADHEWAYDVAPFVNPAQVDYGGTYSVTNDVWHLSLTFNGALTGAQIDVSVNGEDTPGVEILPAPDLAQFLIDLKAAIEALPSVGAGVICTQYTLTGNYYTVKIEFAGADNAGARFAMTARATGASGVVVAATVSHVVFGDPGGEDVQSVSRGYASCGAFFEDRLWQGGFKAKPGAFLASVSGEYFDQNVQLQNAAGAILLNLDADGAERVQHLVPTRFLSIFTTAAEYFISTRPVSRLTPVNVVQASRNGSARQIAPVESEGSLLYVGRERSILYAATYDDVRQTIVSEPISLLASHLVAGVSAAAIQTSSAVTDANRYWMARDDGLAVAAILIRGQEVTGFVRWATDGMVRDVCADGANGVTMLILRVIAGVSRLTFEKLDSTLFLDQAVDIAVAPGATSASGLARLEGASVWAVVDGYVEGPHVVTSGAIALNFAASGATPVTVGRWTPPSVKTLPPPRIVNGERMQLKRPVRVHTVRAHLTGTTSLAIGANGRPATDVPVSFYGAPADQPVAPYSGPIVKQGLSGYSDEGEVEFTQVTPGWLDVRDITLEVRL